MPYVPSRLDEGHGLSPAAVEPRGRAGATLIVTVDCGSTSVAEIAEADAPRDRRDRHRPPPRPRRAARGRRHRQPAARRLDLPGPPAGGERRGLQGRPAAARATSPAARRRRSTSPTWRRSGRSRTSCRSLGENRSIAQLGLERMRTAPRPGHRGAAREGGRRPGRGGPRDRRVRLAPRLNAAGRVGEALDAARLLLAATPEEATTLAAVLEEANLTRRDLMSLPPHRRARRPRRRALPRRQAS